MFSCVHQRNIHIAAAPSNLTKYAKTLCTKTPLSRGVTGKTFTHTEKNKEKKKKRPEKLPHIRLGLPYWQPSKYNEYYADLPTIRKITTFANTVTTYRPKVICTKLRSKYMNSQNQTTFLKRLHCLRLPPGASCSKAD